MALEVKTCLERSEQAGMALRVTHLAEKGTYRCGSRAAEVKS